ncbi:MAG: hypothetical protein CMJ58_23690 [Planctomycetaceae bacterium]|nr:hypothetical protein [Planctomycetaceae bacterium]
MQMKWTIVWSLTLISGIVGCQQSSTPAAGNASSERPAVDGSAYLLPSEPEGAKDVIAVREAAADGEEVLVVGRIGGSENPWIDGRAAFSIVDNSLKACSDIPGDTCAKPWDYCCETPALPSSTALIKVVDQSGELVGADARELLNVQELSTVVVRGKAERDESGNLTVLATGVYVAKK